MLSSMHIIQVFPRILRDSIRGICILTAYSVTGHWNDSGCASQRSLVCLSGTVGSRAVNILSVIAAVSGSVGGGFLRTAAAEQTLSRFSLSPSGGEVRLPYFT